MFAFDTSISSAVQVLDQPAEPTGLTAQGPLDADELDRMHRYWSAANFLTIGQIYLQDNPLLREPLKPEHIKPRLLGHWGTSTGQSFICVHLNRIIRNHNANLVTASIGSVADPYGACQDSSPGNSWIRKNDSHSYGLSRPPVTLESQHTDWPNL